LIRLYKRLKSQQRDPEQPLRLPEGKTASTWDVNVAGFQQSAAGRTLPRAPHRRAESPGFSTSIRLPRTRAASSLPCAHQRATLNGPLTVANRQARLCAGRLQQEHSPPPPSCRTPQRCFRTSEGHLYKFHGLTSRDVTSSMTVNAAIMTGQ